MRSIAPRLGSEPFTEAENERLFLPSDFSLSERAELCLEALATKQTKILDVALGEIVTSLQTVVKTISAAFERKTKHARGQEQNTRSTTKIRTIMGKRLDLILDYNTLRDALQSLNSLDEEKWPTLEEKDTYRKSTEKRRRPGDPTDVEGNLWSLTSAGSLSKLGEYGKVFGDNPGDIPDKEEDDDKDEESICLGGQYTGMFCFLSPMAGILTIVTSKVQRCRYAGVSKLQSLVL